MFIPSLGVSWDPHVTVSWPWELTFQAFTELGLVGVVVGGDGL